MDKITADSVSSRKMLEPLYPSAEFLINMSWDEVDPDLEKLVSLAQEFLATKDY